jgi:hypothetical protein
MPLDLLDLASVEATQDAGHVVRFPCAKAEHMNTRLRGYADRCIITDHEREILM